MFVRFINSSVIDKIVVTNLSGQEVLRIDDADNPVTINLSHLASGPYLLVIYKGDKTFTEHIVKVSGL
jgi:hypothetical protein